MIRKHAIVSGRVQGVGFRYYTRAEATRLGLGGFARNLPDGTVEVEVEGNDADVAELVEWLGTGPHSARVGAVSVNDIEVLGEREFRIES